MKVVVTGGAGNVSKPLTEFLLQRKHDVTVIGRNLHHVTNLVKLGAKAAIGDLQDIAFLKATFSGADAVYLMLPPSWTASDLKKISTEIAEGYSAAIESAGIRYAVFLSSYGAHRLDDAGAISGIGRAEVVLNRLEGVNILHLRAGYFYTNLLLSIDLIKSSGIMGNMFEVAEGKFTVVDTTAIARAAADALESLDFAGHSYRYVVSDETGTDEIASAIGREIGIPDLKWVKFGRDDLKKALLGYGFANGAADDYVEMFATLDTGLLFEDYVKHKPTLQGDSIEAFAKKFAAAYRLKN
jgi:uncharacterized protein YbjT (DUF2867 family)